MSAYILEKAHIDYMLGYLTHRNNCQGTIFYVPNKEAEDGWDRFEAILGESQDTSKLGQILVDQNYRSVNARYNENQVPPPYTYTRQVGQGPDDFEPLQVLKACDCYDYQACKTDDYHTTQAAWIVDIIRKAAIRDLPDYHDAEWHIQW